MAQRRIDFFGSFQPTGADPTATAKYQALAGIASTVQQGAIAFGQEQQREQQRQNELQEQQDVLQAQREATQLQTDEEGQTVAPELRDPLTRAGEAFNEIAISAYRADVRRQSKETLTRLGQEYANDPEGFELAADAYRQGITQNLPPELQFPIDEDIKNSITDRFTRLSTDMFNRERQSGLATIAASMEDINDDILNHARDGNLEALQRDSAELFALEERGIANGYLDALAVATQREQRAEQIERQKIVGALSRIFEQPNLPEENITEAQAYIAEQTANFSEDLSPDQRDAITKELNVALAQQVNNAQQKSVEQQQAEAVAVNQLKLDAKYNRRGGQEIIDDAYRMHANGVLTQADLFRIESDVIEGQQNQFNESQQDQIVIERLRGNDSVIVDKGQVDGYFERHVLPALGNLEPAQAIAEISSFSIATGIVPSRAKQMIANGIYSENPETILAAVEMIDRISEVPGLEIGLNANQEAFAEVAAGLLGVTTPEEAIRLARQQTDPTKQTQVEYRQQQLRDEDIDYVEAVGDVFNGFGEPNVDEGNMFAMAGEYEDLITSYFIETGDFGIAEEKATKRMRKNWQHSTSFDRWMKYPPDTYYSVAGDSSYIKPQLMSWVNQNTVGLDVEDAILISDSETGRMVANGMAPDYLVAIIDGNGAVIPVIATDPETGRQAMQRYAPDRVIQEERVLEQNLAQQLEKQKRAKSMVEAEKEARMVDSFTSRY